MRGGGEIADNDMYLFFFPINTIIITFVSPEDLNADARYRRFIQKRYSTFVRTCEREIQNIVTVSVIRRVKLTVYKHKRSRKDQYGFSTVTVVVNPILK